LLDNHHRLVQKEFSSERPQQFRTLGHDHVVHLTYLETLIVFKTIINFQGKSAVLHDHCLNFDTVVMFQKRTTLK